MEWVYTRRRGPQWKQGWTGQTMSSMSSPPLPLVTIFGIVILLLWLSQYTTNRAQLHHTSINLQLAILLLLILLVFLMIPFSYSGRFALWLQRLEQETVRGSGGSPWTIAILVGFVLVLLSYQSSFQSKWFGPL